MKKILSSEFLRNYSIHILLFLYSIAAALTIIYFNGTGDGGDSILHYQFARYAPQHPEHFFNHWAKPVFVLLACPFAQFGFTGMKIFNVIVSLLTIYITFRVIQKLEIKNALFGVVILIFIPLSFILTFSGLTEPLFALFTILGIYFILSKNLISACILVSFLPFVRSEGLILICIFGLYLILKRKWKLIPLLLVGHLIYSIAGSIVYSDFLWVFNKIPYAKLSSSYGSGKISHFVEQLIYVTGVPIYILFWLGVISIIMKSVIRKASIELQVFVFWGSILFILAHTLFWYFGIFNSMGLKRVLLCIAPLLSIISLMGFNLITEELLKSKKLAGLATKVLLISYVLVFPFTSNKAAIKPEKDLYLSKDQLSAVQAADFVLQNSKPGHRFVFAHPYLSEALKIDPFDDGKDFAPSGKFMDSVKQGDLIIWENWFAVVEHGISKKFLDENSELINVYNSAVRDNNRDILYSVYKRK